MTAIYAILGLLLFGALIAILYYFLVYDRGSVFERALHLAQNGNYMDARGIIRSRISRDPDNVKGHFYLARIYNMEGNQDQELEHLLEIQRINRFVGEVHAVEVILRIAQIYYQRDQYPQAFENFMAVLQFDQKNEHALAHIAFLAAGQAEFDTAVRYFNRLVRVAPNKVDYRIALAVCQAMVKKGKEASEAFQLALAQDNTNQTGSFLAALHAFRSGDPATALELVEELLAHLTDPMILYLGRKMACASWYLKKDFKKALSYAEQCLQMAAEFHWTDEEYDARLAVAYMAMWSGDLEKANDHLLQLEVNNPADQTVLRVADFRMDLEEQVARLDEISPRNFDFVAHMQDWVRFRFAEDLIYKISGLRQSVSFDVLSFFTQDGQEKSIRDKKNEFDPSELINRFNSLSGDAFHMACERIIASQGFKVKKELKKSDKDGLDFLTQSVTDKKVMALFRIRQWSNQPISDIFIRDQQNYMNEHKASLGFVVAGARLTPGAEAALQNLKKVTVINDKALGLLLQSTMGA
ncbi:MAG: tetratricopeptide repeat protein [Leptospiraceae bacterium]|nr:tetratricopeptide repeat protein [Leptospiraceae bacterium]